MKTMKTCDLTGVALDWAVAKGLRPDLVAFADYGSIFPWTKKFKVCFIGYGASFEPSTNWTQGGPIIEREGINLVKMHGHGWHADCGQVATGTTPLIAAMRCYVASKLGDEIEVPTELQPK